jgi:hypothetical protein
MSVSYSLHSLLDYECLLFHLDEWRKKSPSQWIIELPYECRMIELSWTELASRRPEYRSPLRTVRVILLFICHETCLSNGWLAMHYSVSIRSRGNVCLASRWLATDFRSDSTISAFRRQVTVCWKIFMTCLLNLLNYWLYGNVRNLTFLKNKWPHFFHPASIVTLALNAALNTVAVISRWSRTSTRYSTAWHSAVVHVEK